MSKAPRYATGPCDVRLLERTTTATTAGSDLQDADGEGLVKLVPGEKSLFEGRVLASSVLNAAPAAIKVGFLRFMVGMTGAGVVGAIVHPDDLGAFTLDTTFGVQFDDVESEGFVLQVVDGRSATTRTVKVIVELERVRQTLGF